jgi:hypothetical protein
MMPDAVHHDAGGQGVFRTDNPLGHLSPAATTTIEERFKIWIHNGDKAATYPFAWLINFSSLQKAGFTDEAAVSYSHGSGDGLAAFIETTELFTDSTDPTIGYSYAEKGALNITRTILSFTTRLGDELVAGFFAIGQCFF